MAVAGAVLLAAADAPVEGPVAPAAIRPDATPSAQAVASQYLASTHGDANGVEVVGPGHVAFGMSPAGRWLFFGPRGGSHSLFDGAGVVVLARNAAGHEVTVADTRGDDVREAPGLQGLGVVHEGATGGARYPSARADDDGDGRVDEDPLDGIDNDGDGRVDEDYAAIGDEMIVAGCRTGGEAAPGVAGSQPAPGPTVAVHQECYAWSLGHIDEMVAIKVTVRNTGTDPLDDVRIGAAVDRSDDAEFSTRTLGGPNADAFSTPLAARAMVLENGHWPALAVVFASEAAGSWLAGDAAPGAHLADVVSAAERPDALAHPDRRLRGSTEAPHEGTASNPSADKGQCAYGVSPTLGTLAPGAEATVYIALVAVSSEEHADHMIENAFLTIQGDEGHRMIPPPMSITRRNVWGSYHLRVPSDPSAGLTLTLTNPREQDINPVDITQIEGLDLRGATRTELPNGDVTYEITGSVPDDVAAQNRVVLSGRTRGGEMFNAVLRPTGAETEGSIESARRYWNTAGKLDESLLSGSPNPFHDATTITYEVPAQVTDENGATIDFNGMVETSVKVYNVAGRLVSSLIETSHAPGRYEIQWAAQDGAGSGVASGVYYVKLQIGKRFVTKRLIQLK